MTDVAVRCPHCGNLKSADRNGVLAEGLCATCYSKSVHYMEPVNSRDELKTPVPIRMMMKHAQARNLDISMPALAFLSLGVVTTPGEISMYCVALKQRQSKDSLGQITLNTIGMDLFPMGFPTKASLDGMWDSFKQLKDAA